MASNVTEDRDILRMVWDGKLPMCFILAEEEIYSKEKPDPYYMMVQRQTYFPLVTERVQKHFAKNIDPDLKDTKLWLEEEGSPLKWHLPVGVLFDLCSSENRLPWIITVHFTGFPSTELLAYDSKEAVEAQFMSCVKEADWLKHRGQVINGMQHKDHVQLWRAFTNDKFEMFWGVNKKLAENSKEHPIRHIPFRVHQQDRGYSQALISPCKEDGTEHTLLDLLLLAAPQAVSSQDDGTKSEISVLIQGTQVPVNTHLLWLSLHFSHPDNFLHICLVPNT